MSSVEIQSSLAYPLFLFLPSAGAPTGSGKTVLLEYVPAHLTPSLLVHPAFCPFFHLRSPFLQPLAVNNPTSLSTRLAIVQMLLKRVSRATGAFNHRPGEVKAIYMAPLKAIVQEKKEEWIARFGPLGIVCKELTGDSDVSSWSELTSVDILLTTPEKFDSITRRNKDRGGMSFFADCALVIIDEVHLLGDDRGGALEAIVSRLKVLARKPNLANSPLGSLRFAACSATVPNLRDVGQWLNAPIPEGVWEFGEEYRPVTLQTKVLGYDAAKNDFLFEKRLNERLYEVVMNHFCSKPTIVFCNSRDGCVHAAKELVNKAAAARYNPFVRDDSHRHQLAEAAKRAANKSLQQTVLNGVAFHSAALEYPDRDLCEQLFRSRILTILCCTSTLAMGVNLPAYLCVVRGTRQYAGGGTYKEIERGTLLQMCGRAGRPQFDQEGRVVIMTQRQTQGLYAGLVHGTDPIESNLGISMTEHLNAEIASSIVTDAETAIDWLKHSFFYVRICKNPRHYGLSPTLAPENACKGIVLNTLDEISKAGLCELSCSSLSTPTVRALAGGRVMSDLYIRFQTMRLIMGVKSPASVSDLLMMLCNAEEFSQIKLRRDERKMLKEWNVSEDPIVRFKVTEPRGKSGKRVTAKVIRTAAEKIFILVQEQISDQFATTLPPGMRLEVEAVFQNGIRIMQGAVKYFGGLSEGAYAACCNSLRLAKALEMKMYDDTKYPMKQIPQCGKKSVQALANAGMRSLDDILGADPRDLERIVNRAFPHGNHLLDSVLALPCPMNIQIRVKEAWNRGITVQIHIERQCHPTRPTATTTPEEVGQQGQGIPPTSSLSTTPSAPTIRQLSPAGVNVSSRWSARLIVGCRWNDTLLHIERLKQDGLSHNTVENGVPIERTVHCSSLPRPGEDAVFYAALFFDECVGRDVFGELTQRVPLHSRTTPLLGNIADVNPNTLLGPRSSLSKTASPMDATVRSRDWRGGTASESDPLGKENQRHFCRSSNDSPAEVKPKVTWREPLLTSSPPRFSRKPPDLAPSAAAAIPDAETEPGWGDGDVGNHEDDDGAWTDQASPTNPHTCHWGSNTADGWDDDDQASPPCNATWGGSTSHLGPVRSLDPPVEPFPGSSDEVIVLDSPERPAKVLRRASQELPGPADPPTPAPAPGPGPPVQTVTCFKDETCGMEMNMDWDW